MRVAFPENACPVIVLSLPSKTELKTGLGPASGSFFSHVNLKVLQNEGQGWDKLGHGGQD